MAPRKTYHHGDLRNALLTAALALIEENGLEGLSLRKVAACAELRPRYHLAPMPTRTSRTMKTKIRFKPRPPIEVPDR